MSKTELKHFAIKKLNSKPVKNFKKQLCQYFINENDKKDCVTSFDKNFIQSFIRTYQKRMK